MEEAHKELRSLVAEAVALISSMPQEAVDGSPRQIESLMLKKSQSEYSTRRVELLDDLNADLQPQAARLLILAEGLADCLEVSLGRDRQVNGATLSLVTRSILEAAGLIAWILDDAIDPERRCRRLLAWRFADLRQMRLLAGEFADEDGEAREAALRELESEEGILLAKVEELGWKARPTRKRSGHIEAAALLNDEQRAASVPAPRTLATYATDWPSLYGLLSVPVHGSRFGMFANMKMDEPDMTADRGVEFYGFSIPAKSAINVTAIATERACGLYAMWNGIGSSSFAGSVTKLRGGEQAIDHQVPPLTFEQGHDPRMARALETVRGDGQRGNQHFDLAHIVRPAEGIDQPLGR